VGGLVGLLGQVASWYLRAVSGSRPRLNRRSVKAGPIPTPASQKIKRVAR
jgi:hypothetical protein